MPKGTPNTLDDFWPKVAWRGKLPDECWPWTGSVSASGYGTFNLRQRVLSAHRVAYELFHDVKLVSSRTTVIMHVCDNKVCCNPMHLQLGSQKENVAQAIAAGRKPVRGSANPFAKFTDDEVREIRRLHAEGMSYPKLGAMFGMHPQNIGRICRREGYIDVL